MFPIVKLKHHKMGQSSGPYQSHRQEHVWSSSVTQQRPIELAGTSTRRQDASHNMYKNHKSSQLISEKPNINGWIFLFIYVTNQTHDSNLSKKSTSFFSFFQKNLLFIFSPFLAIQSYNIEPQYKASKMIISNSTSCQLRAGKKMD